MNQHVKVGIILVLVMLGGAILFFNKSVPTAYHAPIKVGVVYSLTNEYLNERVAVDAVLMAIDEINQKGGILGSRIEPVVMDCKESDELYTQQIERLIKHDKVSCIFAGGSCSSRRSGEKTIEDLKGLLIYTNKTEGLSQTPGVVYLGSTLNQTIIPAVTWATTVLGLKIFIVGSNNYLSYIADEMIEQQAFSLGASVVGHARVGDNSSTVNQIVADIINAKPHVIFNTMSGSINKDFYKELRACGITPENIPTLSLHGNESELKELKEFVGEYTVSNYFQSLDEKPNNTFIERLKKYSNTVNGAINSTAQTSYSAVYLWAHAVLEAKTTENNAVITCIKKQTFKGPGGVLFVDANQYSWNKVLIGKALYTGQFMVVWSSLENVHPEPYPAYKEVKQWQDFTEKLYKDRRN